MTAWFHQLTARSLQPSPASTEAYDYHRSLPGYRPTPLHDVPALADELGVGRLLVKDESDRFGLPAFKILGTSWAVERLAREGRPPTALVTATDGNHGRALARVGRQRGIPVHVFVPSDVAPRAIADEGATVTTVDGTYDDAVEAAAAFAGATGATLVQDTAWPGYTDVPDIIAAGYRTMLLEIDEELGPVQPDLVVVPVGVGTLAQAVVGHYASAHTAVLGVEPSTAASLLTSLRSGRRQRIDTGHTVMAGLNCGQPSSLAWPILRRRLDAAITVEDTEAKRAVDDLATNAITAGPSGAASLAGLRAALTGPSAAARRTELDVTADSVVLVLSTERGSRSEK